MPRGIQRIDAGIYGWANVLYEGAYNLPHGHPKCMWAGVYYVDVGEQPQDSVLSGMIEFIDPRAGVSMMPLPGNPFDGRYKVQPRTGLMILFPAWLVHSVETNPSDGIRTSISFNIMFSDYVQRMSYPKWDGIPLDTHKKARV